MRKLGVIWRAAGLLMATSAELVVEVVPPVAWRPAPGAPEWVRGLFSYRSNLIPLVDATRLLGTHPSADRMVNRVIVVRTGANGGSTPSLIGLWVESVLELERIDFDAEGGHPGFATDGGRFLGPVAQTQWGQVQLVHPGELFSPEQNAVLMERIGAGVA